MKFPCTSASHVTIQTVDSNGGGEESLDFNESRLEVVGIRDIVLDSGATRIRDAAFEHGLTQSTVDHHLQHARRQGGNNVTPVVAVTASFSSGVEAPLRDHYSISIQLSVGRCL